MRLWYFFREKRFIRAYICWFFIACVLPSKYHYSLIPVVGRIMFRRHLPFYDCVPSHNFFRNFLARSFVVSIIIVTFAVSYPCWKPSMGKGGGAYIHKRRNCTLWFWRIWISQIQTICQKQSNGNASWGVSYIYSPYWLMAYCREFIGGTIYLHRRGAFSVARFGR